MKKKKLIASLLLSCAIIAGFPNNASAASVVLSITQTNVTSASIGLQTAANWNAKNASTSERAVYAIVNKAAPGKGWVTAGENSIGVGQSGSGSYYDGGSCNWNLELNPQGWLTSGCAASGNIF